RRPPPPCGRSCRAPSGETTAPTTIRQPLRSARHAPCVHPPLRIRTFSRTFIFFRGVSFAYKAYLPALISKIHPEKARFRRNRRAPASSRYFARRVLTPPPGWI